MKWFLIAYGRAARSLCSIKSHWWTEYTSRSTYCNVCISRTNTIVAHRETQYPPSVEAGAMHFAYASCLMYTLPKSTCETTGLLVRAKFAITLQLHHYPLRAYWAIAFAASTVNRRSAKVAVILLFALLFDVPLLAVMDSASNALSRDAIILWMYAYALRYDCIGWLFMHSANAAYSQPHAHALARGCSFCNGSYQANNVRIWSDDV